MYVCIYIYIFIYMYVYANKYIYNIYIYMTNKYLPDCGIELFDRSVFCF